MSEASMEFSLSIYLVSAVFFVIVNGKCFLGKKHIKEKILCFFLSPSVGYVLAATLTTEFWKSMFELNNLEIVMNVLIIAGIQVVIQMLMMYFYLKVIYAHNKSIAAFIYLCSIMLIPSFYYLMTSSTLIPYFLYLGLHILFYYAVVRPLSEITKTRQITNTKLYILLPTITFLFNTIIYIFYFYISSVGTISDDMVQKWVQVLKSDNEELRENAKSILILFKTFVVLQTDVILYPSIFITTILIIAFYVIVRNIKFMNEAIEAQKKVKDLSVEVMEALAHTIDAKDEYTKGHSIRVARYSRMIAEQMKLPPEKCEDVYYMGLLHDLGKIGVPNEIINKPSRLTEEEYEVIKGHPVTGFGILAEIKSRPDLSIGARWHHERYDGNGYPDHKKGEEIPLEARIIAVADSYDAMTSNRSYRNYLPQVTVRSELEKNSGTQFDPVVAGAMIELIDQDKEYRLHE